MKKGLALLTAALLCAALAACSSDDRHGRTEKETAGRYVAALNARDAQGLVKACEHLPLHAAYVELREAQGTTVHVSEQGIPTASPCCPAPRG